MSNYSKPYTFKRTDNSPVSKACEMSIKNALHCKNADKVSPPGAPDFRKYGHCYDVKVNGTVVQYSPDSKYISGSSRVIYATHADYIVTAEDEDFITIRINLATTQFYCVDRNAFVAFLLENGHVKQNKSRNTVNIQTLYNYKKDAYHGKRGYEIEKWLQENELEDEVLPAVWASLED